MNHAIQLYRQYMSRLMPRPSHTGRRPLARPCCRLISSDPTRNILLATHVLPRPRLDYPTDLMQQTKSVFVDPGLGDLAGGEANDRDGSPRHAPATGC